MIETINLYKKYKPKRGVPVTAIDDVSLKFPDRGMVFLLGKSGSGKSTLLNLLGGLDRYDGGEIIIKGVSSKNFSQQYFDSYRNTYVGFIFQEYNILDEFTVGANIALAIELQGKRATNDQINSILREVDLEGYGSRRPNELSGGQKQRVAIARALVKNPAIIMADEPTGALDSNTGKQVFDTLKKLSSDKLIICVSHDREFAEQYADRIIELSDGKVIDDVTLDNSAAAEQALSFNDNEITVPAGYELTEEDRTSINEYIRSIQNKESRILVSGGSKNRFAKTDQSKIDMKSDEKFDLIKSKLPIRNAVKIGASGMKHKKFRLVFTIFLSVVAFALFGLADTFGSYDNISACTQSILDTGVRFASFSKSEKKYYDDDDTRYYYNSTNLDEDDISEIKKNTGVDVTGVYCPSFINLSLKEYYNEEAVLTDSYYDIYSSYLSGFAEMTQENIDSMGYKLVAGELPRGDKDEIAISLYVAQTFLKAGILSDDGSYTSIDSPDSLVGYEFSFGDVNYRITGIIDTKRDFERYLPLTEDTKYNTVTDNLIDYVLYNEFNYEKNFSFCNTAIVGAGFIDRMIEQLPPFSYINNGSMGLYNDDGLYLNVNYASKLSQIDGSYIEWLDGQPRTELGEKEIIISLSMLQPYDIYRAKNYSLSTDNLSDVDLDSLGEAVFDLDWYRPSGSYNTENGWKIVGIIKDEGKYENIYDSVVLPDSLYSEVVTEAGLYSFAVGAMPENRSDIKNIVDYSYREDDVRYNLQNSVTYELNMVNEALEIFSKVFLYVGIGFAVFASLMFANFIGTSISYKRREIGILRAIGSRSSDVFRIFFSESFIIAMINFLLSSAGTIAATLFINFKIRESYGILITVLNFGLRQLLLIFAVAVAVAFVASFIPVMKIASKRPIHAIRNK